MISNFGFRISDLNDDDACSFKSEIQNPNSKMICGGWNRTNGLLGQSQVLRTSSNRPAVFSIN